MTAPIASPASPPPTPKMPPVPAPDTPEGRVLILGLITAAVYVLLLVADDVALANQAAAYIELPLILGTVVAFAIGGMLGADFARARLFELELARTVSVHGSSDQLPEEDSPLGGVMKEYARAAEEHRRHARSHAYAVGPAMWGGLGALTATVAWGFALATGANWLTYLALVIELPTLALLVLSVSVLGTATGMHRDAPFFALWTPRRWRGFGATIPAVETAYQTCPWLAGYVQGLRTESGWSSSAASATRPWSEA